MSDIAAPNTRKRSKRGQDEKTARIDIRVTPEEKEDLSQSARKLGLSLSEYVLLTCSSDPEQLQNILRKARPVERADPQLITVLARANLLLGELRDLLKDRNADTPITYSAVLSTLLTVHRQLETVRL